MKITLEDEYGTVAVSREGVTWLDALGVFLDVLRGYGYMLIASNGEILEAVEEAQNDARKREQYYSGFGASMRSDIVEDGKLADGGNDE